MSCTRSELGILDQFAADDVFVGEVRMPTVHVVADKQWDRCQKRQATPVFTILTSRSSTDFLANPRVYPRMLTSLR